MKQAPVLVTLIGTLLFAGCVGDDGAGPVKEAVPPVAEEAITTVKTGSVKGQIYTVDLEPVIKEPVALLAPGTNEPVMTTRTDLQGRFTFNGVEPGAYRLHIDGECCIEALKELVVNSGEVAEINVQLERDVGQQRYVEENDWAGFYGCGFASGITVDLCGRLEGTPVEDPNHDVVHYFNVTQGLRTLVVGMEWRAVGGVSGEELMLHINKVTDGGYRYARADGYSPLLARIDDEAVRDPQVRFTEIPEEGWTLQHYVWVPWRPFNMVYQQPFHVYWHEYYNMDAPEDANPLPGE